ncbi:hypothetical protein ILUMI_23690 [Ignelater luminosus]|uniref:Endonuclease/exonuclease/phosphatase domain-containing protein n=1 Tax=Ignelater luminosus TaxID=2038154 RepID=A0A8K0FWT9_IGNLU|nr:hypothetical protein ILUMI_23690 [Ignelater luminosus]
MSDVCLISLEGVTSDKREVGEKGAKDQVEEIIRGKNKEVILVGDVNAKSPLWGSPHVDERRQLWAEYITALDLVVKNEGEEPTFVRRDRKSHIDITVATRVMARRIRDWAVLPDENSTDHRYIRYKIVVPEAAAARREPTKVLINWEIFRTELQRGVEGSTQMKKRATQNARKTRLVAKVEERGGFAELQGPVKGGLRLQDSIDPGVAGDNSNDPYRSIGLRKEVRT